MLFLDIHNFLGLIFTKRCWWSKLIQPPKFTVGVPQPGPSKKAPSTTPPLYSGSASVASRQSTTLSLFLL